MSMKTLPLKKHQCPRQRCQGDAKDYQNYMANLNLSKHKQKRPNTTRSQPSIHEHLIKAFKAQPKSKPSKPSIQSKQQLSELKRRNEENLLKNSQLTERLQQKSRKINDLKHKIKDYESRIKHYQQKVAHLQSVISETEHPQSPMSLQKPSEHILSSYQQQLKTFQTNQKAMIEHIDKYRIIEKQYQQYRTDTERKIEQLIRQNQQLRQIENNEKDYDGEIDQIRRELQKLSAQQSPDRNSLSQSEENQIKALKANNKQLMTEREHFICKIEEQAIKEGELRHNLETINKKVERWGEEYKLVLSEKSKLEERCSYLDTRLQQKKQRHQHEKQQWARIFRELMHQVQKLKRQIGRLQKSNHKLINIYSEQTE